MLYKAYSLLRELIPFDPSKYLKIFAQSRARKVVAVRDQGIELFFRREVHLGRCQERAICVQLVRGQVRAKWPP